MKKLMNTIIIIAVLFGALYVGTWADSYTIEAKCISTTNGVIELLDTHKGNTWIWEAEEGETFIVGNLYEITLYKGHLQSYEDDVIIKIKEAKLNEGFKFYKLRRQL